VDPLFPNSSQEYRHAHVGETDVIVYNTDRTWDFTAQGAGPLLSGHTPDTLGTAPCLIGLTQPR
jgi:hypothetical protein